MRKLLLTAILLTSFSAMATEQDPTRNMSEAEKAKYYEIANVQVVDVTDQYPLEMTENGILDGLNNGGLLKLAGPAAGLDQVAEGLDKVELIVDKIINIGTKILNVIEKGKAVQSYQNNTASALPLNTLRIDQLQNWQDPKTKVVSITYTNFYGMEVIRFTYRISMLYGGDYNGVGKYIGKVSVEPVEMTTSYGFSFDALSEVDSVYNKGSSANPLGGLTLNIKWKASAWNKTTNVTHSYKLDGLGNISAIDEAN